MQTNFKRQILFIGTSVIHWNIKPYKYNLRLFFFPNMVNLLLKAYYKMQYISIWSDALQAGRKTK